MMKSEVFTRYKVGLVPKKITLTTPAISANYTYPSEFFKAEQKPRFTKYVADDVSDIYKLIGHTLSSGDYDIDTVLVFLSEVEKKIVMVLDQDWKSFNVKIGSAGETITPFSVYLTKEKKVFLTGTKGVGSESDAFGMAVIILSIFRLAPYNVGSDFESYRTTLSDKIKAQATTLGFKGASAVNLTLLLTKCISWATNPEYRKVAAAFDMFLNKFPNCAYVSMRISTLTSRFRDSSALLSVTYLMESLSINLGQFLDWILVGVVAAEVDRVFKPDEEMDIKDSYGPYIMDMGISSKSPYSSATNPSLHMFIHTVGVSMMIPRSCNAKLLSTGSMTGAVMNGKLMAFAHSKIILFKQIYVETEESAKQQALAEAAGTSGTNHEQAERKEGGEENQSDSESDEEDESLGYSGTSFPSNLSPQSWLIWFHKVGNQFPAEVEAHFKLQWSKIKNPREGSIGAYFKNLGNPTPEL